MRDNFGRSAVQGPWALVLALVIPFAAFAASGGEIRNYLISINRLYESLDYEFALNRIQLARQLPRGTEEEVTLSLYEGIILCEMDKQGPGASAFRAALLLRPDAKLPVQVAPKVEQLFESVRKQVKKEVAPILAPREGNYRDVAPPRKAEPAKGTAEASPSPGAPKQEGRADKDQTDPSRCQPAVIAECGRLLKQLFSLQEKYLRTDSSFRLGPIQELAGIAQQLRAARTSKALQETAQALDSWQQRHLPQ